MFNFRHGERKTDEHTSYLGRYTNLKPYGAVRKAALRHDRHVG